MQAVLAVDELEKRVDAALAAKADAR